MQFTTLALAALASLASAQRTWVVTVAQNGTLTYSPERLAPQPGEFVQFQFHAGNHTVTQSTFGAPCTPIGVTNTNVTGFHSGFLPVAASAEMGMIPTYTIQINDTNPIWMYCAKGQHCQGGMVMVINEPTNPDRSLDAFKTAAAQAQTALPGGAVDAGAGGTTGTTTPGEVPDSTDNNNQGASQTTVSVGAAGMLTVPGTVALIAAAGFAILL